MSCDVATDAKVKELPPAAAELAGGKAPPSSSSHAASSAMGLTSAAGGGVGGGGPSARPEALQERERNSSGSSGGSGGRSSPEGRARGSPMRAWVAELRREGGVTSVGVCVTIRGEETRVRRASGGSGRGGAGG
jgi:hypothetical protein